MSKPELEVVGEMTDEEKEQEVRNIKAQMFDLMVQRDHFNQQIQMQLKALSDRLSALSS